MKPYVFIGVTLAWTVYDSLWCSLWFTAGISGSYSSGFTSLSGRESVSSSLLAAFSKCLPQWTALDRHRHFLFRYWRIRIFFDIMYRMYNVSAACGMPIISSTVNPIKLLYLCKYLTSKLNSACILSKARSRLSTVFEWSGGGHSTRYTPTLASLPSLSPLPSLPPFPSLPPSQLLGERA